MAIKTTKPETPAAAKPQRPAPPPIITPEADKELSAVMKRYGTIFFAMVIFLPVGIIILSSRFPHNKLLAVNGPLGWVAAAAWLIPFYFIYDKTSQMRIGFGRKYAAEQRWKETVAALNVFMEFGQRSFDRTGEAHYLLAQAYDRVGKRDKAEKARQFIRKHRASTPWGIKLTGVVPAAQAAAAPAAFRRKSAASSDGADTAAAAEHKRAVAAHGSKGRKRRF